MAYDEASRCPLPLTTEQAEFHRQELSHAKAKDLTDMSRYVKDYKYKTCTTANEFPCLPYMLWNGNGRVDGTDEHNHVGESKLDWYKEQKMASSAHKLYEFFEKYAHNEETVNPCLESEDDKQGQNVKDKKFTDPNPRGYPRNAMRGEHFITRLLAGVSGAQSNNEALVWAHRLILQNDATRFPQGEGAKALKTISKDATPDIKKRADMELDKYQTDVRYKLDSDLERNIALLECLPRTSRAFYSLRAMYEKVSEPIEDAFMWNAMTNDESKAANVIGRTRSTADKQTTNYLTNFNVGDVMFATKDDGAEYVPDRYMNVYTPTPRDRAEWVVDQLNDRYNIVYQPKVKTHREPLVDQWNLCRNVYGKAGPISEDGLIQQGHYMRVGRKAGETNAFFDSHEIFWLSNVDPPQGTISAWIPDHVGGVREVWFSDAATDAEEEKFAFDEGRIPYMRYATQKEQRSWEMWVPNIADLEETQRIPRKPALRLVPQLPVFNNYKDAPAGYENTNEYIPSLKFEDLPVPYYPSVGLQDPDAKPLGAGAGPSTVVQATTYNPTLYGGYPLASLQAPQSDDYSDDYDYSGDYSDEYGDDYGDYSDYSNDY